MGYIRLYATVLSSLSLLMAFPIWSPQNVLGSATFVSQFTHRQIVNPAGTRAAASSWARLEPVGHTSQIVNHRE